MIAKKKMSVNRSRPGRTGDAAERQMAFYLDRTFGQSRKMHLIHDLRILNNDDVAQIDHLVLHPYGLIIVESKSVSGRVVINQHGEWKRCWGKGMQKGKPSPIQQAKRQGALLLDLLEDKYGYYLKCVECGKNTPIEYTCISCSRKGRIRKQGPRFIRFCGHCGMETTVWDNHSAPST